MRLGWFARLRELFTVEPLPPPFVMPDPPPPESLRHKPITDPDLMIYLAMAGRCPREW